MGRCVSCGGRNPTGRPPGSPWGMSRTQPTTPAARSCPASTRGWPQVRSVHQSAGGAACPLPPTKNPSPTRRPAGVPYGVPGSQIKRQRGWRAATWTDQAGKGLVQVSGRRDQASPTGTMDHASFAYLMCWWAVLRWDEYSVGSCRCVDVPANTIRHPPAELVG